MLTLQSKAATLFNQVMPFHPRLTGHCFDAGCACLTGVSVHQIIFMKEKS